MLSRSFISTVAVRAHFALLLWALGAGAAERPAISGDLTAEQIVERTVTRAKWTHGLKRHTNYTYDKKTVTEEFDGKGRIRYRKEKVLQFQSGVGTVTELKINDKPVAARELRKEAESTADRQHLTRGKSARKDDNWDEYFSRELISRYTFELVGREPVAGRDAYVLSFKPVSDKLPVKQITDRLINRLVGKVWVDAREFEIAKAEIGLLSDVTMWGGVLGAMKKFDFDVERSRVDDGIWFNRISNFELEGRKLFDGTHIRVRSETGNFRRSVAFK
jgi:hypothetical protein